VLQPIAQSDKAKNCAIDQHTPTTFKTYLTHFACGHLTVLGNGTIMRQFTLNADDDYNGTGTPIIISTNTYGLGKPLTSSNQTSKPVIFHAWTFNGNYYLLSFICITFYLSINKVITVKLDVVISFLLY
jgi:hypothetical protein